MARRTVTSLIVAALTCLIQQAAASHRLLLQQQAQQLSAWQQCGGMGACRSAADCGDRPWTNAYCTQGHACQRYDAWYWQCRPGTAPQSFTQQQPTVKAWDQCGGSFCKQGNCGDNPWATCPSGYTCVRKDQWYWQCRSQPLGSNIATRTQQEQGSGAKPQNAQGSSQLVFQSVDQTRPAAASNTASAAAKPSGTASPVSSRTKPRQVSKSQNTKPSSSNDPDGVVIQEVDESVIERMTAVPPPPPPPPPPQEQPVVQQQQPLPFFLPFFG